MCDSFSQTLHHRYDNNANANAHRFEQRKFTQTKGKKDTYIRENQSTIQTDLPFSVLFVLRRRKTDRRVQYLRQNSFRLFRREKFSRQSKTRSWDSFSNLYTKRHFQSILYYLNSIQIRDIAVDADFLFSVRI